MGLIVLRLVVTTDDEYVVAVDSILYSLLRPRTQTTSTTSREVQVVLSRALYRLPAGMSCHLIGETGLIPLSNIPKPIPRRKAWRRRPFWFLISVSLLAAVFSTCYDHKRRQRLHVQSTNKNQVLQGRKSQCFDCYGSESLLAGGEETLAPPLSLHPVPFSLLSSSDFREVRSVAAACEVRVQQATAFVISCAVVYICVYIPVLS